MKYFTYNLKPVGFGEAAGPTHVLQYNGILGCLVSGNPYVYYGCAEIDNIDILKEYNGLEITEAEFNAVYRPVLAGTGSI